jgi:hypothetical protein
MKNFQSRWGNHLGYKQDYKKDRGIVMIVIIIVIALLILSYYGFNLRQTIQSPTTQDNFSYAWGGVTYVWDNYLQTPVDYFYNFFVNDIWKPSIIDIENINANRLPNAENNIPDQYPTPPATQ